jgi:hypothetical protein
VSQVDNLHDLFRTHNNQLTLGQILANWQLVGSKYTNRISELEERLEQKGLTIDCQQNHDRPTDNLYRIIPMGQKDLFA